MKYQKVRSQIWLKWYRCVPPSFPFVLLLQDSAPLLFWVSLVLQLPIRLVTCSFTHNRSWGNDRWSIFQALVATTLTQVRWKVAPNLHSHYSMRPFRKITPCYVGVFYFVIECKFRFSLFFMVFFPSAILAKRIVVVTIDLAKIRFLQQRFCLQENFTQKSGEVLLFRTQHVFFS